MGAETRIRGAAYSRRAFIARPPGTRCGKCSRIGLAVAAALAGVTAGHAAPALAADAAAATTDAAAAARPGAPGASSPSTGLAEVVVTARKVTENLQDVPVSLSVFTEKDLKNLGITQFEDFATRDPSVSFISTGPGEQLFVIRGVSDGSNPNYSNTSLTGFFVDDLSLSWYGVQPDLHLYDLERIEVLKGPQGTTFGAGSMSGAVRYITNKPDVNNFGAGVDFDGGQIEHAGRNYTEEGFLNLPLIAGSLGLRLSVYDSVHGGFIDNKLITRDWVNGTVSNNAEWAGNDYNTQHTKGARVALKEVFTPGWSATVTWSIQQQIGFGAWDELTPKYGEDAVARFGPEERHNDASLLDAHLDGDLGIADLVFASTYWNVSTRQLDEYSEYMQYAQTAGHAPISPQYLQGFACLTDPVSSPGDSFTGCNVPIEYYDYKDYTRRWSNELRLTSKPGGRFHWLAGLYWEHTEDQSSNFYTMPGIQYGGQAWQAAAAYYYPEVPTPPPQDWYSYLEYTDYLQATEFANINFDLTDRLNIEAGAVHFHSDFSSYTPYAAFSYQPTGPGEVGGPSASNGGSHKWDSRFGINYKVLDNVLVYATFAQGFRDGGVNTGLPQACYTAGVPQQYTPDTLNNYEIGWKATLLDRHLIWDGAVYYMPWKNFQTNIYDPSVCTSGSYNANLGTARVYGAESNVDFKINDHWALQGAVNYTDAELTSNTYVNPFFDVPAGSRLPYAPYFDWSGNVRYETPLSARLAGYAQYDIAYKGDMYNNLSSVTGNGFPRFLQPPYDIMNLRIGINPPSGRWLAEFYITNLANKNAIIYTNTGNFDLRQTTNEPRVFGIRLNYRFGKAAGGAEE
jgi:iron complex outermembrane recepter protein